MFTSIDLVGVHWKRKRVRFPN